jgi:hypothetical protein
MGNQQKAEFINGNVGIRIFWVGHGEISSKSRFMPEGQVCPDFPEFSNPT